MKGNEPRALLRSIVHAYTEASGAAYARRDDLAALRYREAAHSVAQLVDAVPDLPAPTPRAVEPGSDIERQVTGTNLRGVRP